VFALAESLDSGGVGGVDAEVEAADAFDGGDFSVEKTVDGFRDGILGRDIFTPLTRSAKGMGSCFPTLAAQVWGTHGLRIDDFEGELGAALPAGVGLGVEAAVEWVIVFGLAGGAHCECGHGGLWPVVGDAAGDGEAGAAVGAVEERVAVAAVTRIEKLAEAVGAGGGVGGDAGGNLSFDLAGNDAEAGFASSGQVSDGNGVDAGQGRSFGAKTGEKSVDARRRALKFDGDALGVVGDGTGEVFFRGQAVDEGAEADALDDAADENRTPTALGAVLGVLRGFFARFRFWLG